MDDASTTQQPSDDNTEMSFTDKLMNVFSAPGELFESVAKSEKQTSNWSVPLVLAMIVSIIFVLVAFSQAPIQDQMRDRDGENNSKEGGRGKDDAGTGRPGAIEKPSAAGIAPFHDIWFGRRSHHDSRCAVWFRSCILACREVGL